MSAEGVDTVVLTDPRSIVWISGYDAWCFYVPQALAISPESVVAYTDEMGQIAGRNPAQFILNEIGRRNLGRGTIGLELDSFYLTPRYRDCLVSTTMRESYATGSRAASGSPTKSSASTNSGANFISSQVEQAPVMVLRDRDGKLIAILERGDTRALEAAG